MILEFFKREWKFLLGLLLVIAVLCVGYYEYRSSKNVPMATVASVDYNEVAKAMATLKPDATPAEIKTITEKITEVKQGAPQIVYVTATQGQAEARAQELTKADKGDLVIKETTSPVTNSFYSVHTEKNHKVKAGVTVLDKEAYVDLGYQQGKNEVILHYSPVSQKYGATYVRTIVEW